MGVLSGGNMQKAIIAREFTSGSNVIIANQPTRGVDVGSTEFIISQILLLSKQMHVSVLFISADLSEVMAVSDSLIVLHKGGLTAYFDDAKRVTDLEVGEYMLGVSKMPNDLLDKARYEDSKNIL